MHHDQMQELMGAYALDAVDPAEDEAVQRHLVDCPACRHEVAGLQEVAALLAHVGGPAPARLWDGIASEVSDYRDGRPPRQSPAIDRRQSPAIDPRPSAGSPPAANPQPAAGPPPAAGIPPVIDLPPAAGHRLASRTHHAVSLRVFTAVVALAAVFIAALGLQLGHLNDRTRSRQSAWQAAVVSPDARELTLVSSDGSRSAMAVVEADGTSYLGPNNLPALPAERSYQLWGKVGQNMVSLAVLRTPSPYQKFSTPAETQALIITNEAASGVISSRQPAVVSSAVPGR